MILQDYHEDVRPRQKSTPLREVYLGLTDAWPDDGHDDRCTSCRRVLLGYHKLDGPNALDHFSVGP